MTHEFSPLPEHATVDRAIELYPNAAPWLYEHVSAQILDVDGQRLPSADEKIWHGGGSEQLESLFASELKRNRYKLPILRACMGGPMHPLEVGLYLLNLGFQANRNQLSREITELGQAGYLEPVWSVTHILRIKNPDPEAVQILPNALGIRITETGLHLFNQGVGRPRRLGLGGLVYRPQGT